MSDAKTNLFCSKRNTKRLEKELFCAKIKTGGESVMKYYEKLVELGCFSRQNLVNITGSESAAASLIYEYLKKNYIERVRHDTYTVISLETRQPILSRYQIGSYLFSDAYLTHHSALELYGYANQVFYEIYISSSHRFSDFVYNGTLYHRVMPKNNSQVIMTGGIRVTELEQTIVDSIQDFEKISGIEEVIRCLLLVPSLDAKKILQALSEAGNGFLYQKCGYIFEELNSSLRLPQWFFEECQKYMSNSKRYLINSKRTLVYNSKWKLYVPYSLMSLVNKGVSDYNAV